MFDETKKTRINILSRMPAGSRRYLSYGASPCKKRWIIHCVLYIYVICFICSNQIWSGKIAQKCTRQLSEKQPKQIKMHRNAPEAPLKFQKRLSSDYPEMLHILVNKDLLSFLRGLLGTDGIFSRRLILGPISLSFSSDDLAFFDVKNGCCTKLLSSGWSQHTRNRRSSLNHEDL